MIIKGQSCVTGSRIFVQEGICDEFLKIFTTTAAHPISKTGDPFGKEPEHGPQVSKFQFDLCPSSMDYIFVNPFLFSAWWVTSTPGKEAGATVHYAPW